MADRQFSPFQAYGQGYKLVRITVNVTGSGTFTLSPATTAGAYWSCAYSGTGIYTFTPQNTDDPGSPGLTAWCQLIAPAGTFDAKVDVTSCTASTGVIVVQTKKSSDGSALALTNTSSGFHLFALLKNSSEGP